MHIGPHEVSSSVDILQLRSGLPRHELSKVEHPTDAETYSDCRFQNLLGLDAWAQLSKPVQRRFSLKQAPHQAIVYVGVVKHCFMSRAGWLLAQLCRLTGSPLPLNRDVDVPSVVTVTTDLSGGGQNWARLYARANGFPQVIHSIKCFTGPTGLEEHIGRGVGMTLRVSVEAQPVNDAADDDCSHALVFSSERYFITLAGHRFHLPHWLTPGRLTVRHIPIDANQFIFSLEIEHPTLGLLLRQTAHFKETT